MSSPLIPQMPKSSSYHLEVSLAAASAAPNKKKLPLELWIKIASYVDRSNLYTFSQLSRSHHYAALTELNTLKLETALKHLQELTQMHENIPKKLKLGVLDCYQSIIRVLICLKLLNKNQIISLSTEIEKKRCWICIKRL